MDLTSAKLEEFIEEELDSTFTIEEVINELEEVSEVFTENLKRLEDIKEKCEGNNKEVAEKLQVFYYQILDETSDLNFFIEELKHRYNYK